MRGRWFLLFHRPGVQTFDLTPGAIATALVLKYITLMLYGSLAIYFNITSFVVVGGSLFAILWASAILFFATFALFALLRTWYQNKFGLELWAIALLVLMFLAYSVVIVVRGVLTDNWDAIATACLPLGFSWLPAIRYYSLMARRDDE